MNTRFNLVDDAWIPIGGTEVSLTDVLTRAHDLPGWPDGEPGFVAVLLRLLTAITYRITGMDDDSLSRSAFANRQQQLLQFGRFDALRVNEYLGRCRDRFWLLNPPDGFPPFAQDQTLAVIDAHKITKAVLSWSSARQALGPHTNCDFISIEVAARQLLIQRSYAAGGIQTPHPSTSKPRAYLKNGPLRGTMSLHPVGETLAATLIGHLVPHLGDGTGFGKPFWETPSPSDPLTPHKGTPGLIEQIVGRQDKTMLLRSADDGTVSGFTIAEGPGGDSKLRCRDPYLLVDNNTEEPRKPKAGRAFWRESEALLARRTEDPDLRARILRWATGEYTGGTYKPDMFSWAVINHLGDQSNEKSWAVSTCPDLLVLFDDLDAAGRAIYFMELANSAEEVLIKQLAKLYHDVDLMPSKPEDKAAIYAPARAEFWRRAEQNFWNSAAGRSNTDIDMNQLRSHALKSYDIVTVALTHDRRTHMSTVKNRRWINMWERSPRVSTNKRSSD